MIIKNIKDTKNDRRYFDEKGKIGEAARAGKLGKSWYRPDPKTGELKLSPKAAHGRV